MTIQHVLLGQATLTSVRIPFRRSERAWVLPARDGESVRRVVRIGGRGSLPVGAVELGNGEYLNLHSGAIYRVEVRDNQ